MSGRKAETVDSAEAVAAATAHIDAYLASLPTAKHDALEALRRTIAAAAPEAVEAISYGIPAFRYLGRPLAGYAAAAAHCSFFPMSSELIAIHRSELAGFSTAKGTIRFTPERRLPVDLVTAIVRERMAQIEAARSQGPRRR